MRSAEGGIKRKGGDWEKVIDQISDTGFEKTM